MRGRYLPLSAGSLTTSISSGTGALLPAIWASAEHALSGNTASALYG